MEHISSIIERELKKLERQKQAISTTEGLIEILRNQQVLESKQLDLEKQLQQKKGALPKK